MNKNKTKTIFIALFEGVEGKNILRTDILKTLLSEPSSKIVFFTKSQERAEYHRKEFNNPRMIYEVVEKIQPKGLDKFFMYLKFYLLRTDTTKFLQKAVLEDRKNYLRYWTNSFLSWFLARPFFIKISRFLDYHFVKDDTFGGFFDKHNPDLVFLANIFEETETHLLREAKKRKTKTVGLINSWDRTTGKNVLRLLPDKLIAFSDLVKNELVKYQDVKSGSIFVGGIPHYDYHFRAPYLSRRDFFQKIGIPENKKLIVFCPIGSQYSDSDWDIFDLLCNLNKEGKFGEDVAILVRYPPNDFIEEEEVRKRPHLVYDYPGIRFCQKKKGIDWDMTTEELKHLSDSLHYMALMVCYSSSISVEAAVCGKPIINLNFEVKKSESPLKSPIHYYNKLHYKKALGTGGICLVNSEEEMVKSIKKYLENPSLDSGQRKILSKQQCWFLDGKSGERIGKFVLGQMES
ncbi:CDP-glycerol glycerophosphotransferase family protein [Patescibacteria group bacterium]|nr:CDP-glycerol glycerophosphotransferase family protein [Patescibacteria group bacterium]